ncbi:MAG TPA: RdgB/HAM1 family non-canonical purine NTP pyrophosphatase [Candidatus Eremiobacteraceae bacterium]|nr:RdgB/HAM1 family non-canonical purine NTP pyrophosphatase [Candidatus Eremiobacteraceae bacterium]
MSEPPAAPKLALASANPGKLREYQVLASGHAANLEWLPGFAAVPEFPEDAPTFAENAAGKALYYSKHCGEMVFADDSGLVVPALGGAPGVFSARYAGPGASSAARNAKLLAELRGKNGANRDAHFVCVIALAVRGRCLAVVSGKVEGEILEEPRGVGGFGYDPVFYFPPLHKAFAELTAEEKNQHSHRGKAFRRLMEILEQQS